MTIPVRLGLFYAALFLGSGVSGPYLSLWLDAHGMTGAQIGAIFSAPLLARVVSAPLLAVWADGFRLRRTPMALLAVAVTGLYLAFPLMTGFWGWFAVWFVLQTLFSVISPLADVLALRRSMRDGFNYGWPRGIGSVAYIVANVGMGAILSIARVDAVLIWTTLAALASAMVGQWLLPPDPVHEEGGPKLGAERFAGVARLLRDRDFMLAATSVGLIQASHAFYYSFSTLVWKGQGIAPSVTGVIWGVAVAVEVCFLWFMEPLRRRLGPERLLALGAAAGVVRWTAFAFAPPLWLVFPLQALHTLTFAATFVGGLQLIDRLAPRDSASAAQTISSALSGGVLIGLATWASGPLFDAVGAKGYLLMSLFCALGLLGALRLMERPATA